MCVYINGVISSNVILPVCDFIVIKAKIIFLTITNKFTDIIL